MTARYLSPEWFAAVEAASPPPGPDRPDVVLEQVVEGTPDGPVRYRVEVTGATARIVWPVAPDRAPADLRITSDWPTAVELAQGTLSAQSALMRGRIRVSGNPQHLAATAPALGGVDPVPPSVRAGTTYAA